MLIYNQIKSILYPEAARTHTLEAKSSFQLNVLKEA